FLCRRAGPGCACPFACVVAEVLRWIAAMRRDRLSSPPFARSARLRRRWWDRCAAQRAVQWWLGGYRRPALGSLLCRHVRERVWLLVQRLAPGWWCPVGRIARLRRRRPRLRPAALRRPLSLPARSHFARAWCRR